MSTAHTTWAVLKTLVFLVLFWLVFLYALPIGLSIVEVDLGIQRFPPKPLLAAALLLVFTVIATWSALTLAIAGKGTPLPFDPPQSLVTAGPYAYLRHPFVAAVTGQIVGLGIALGSVPILAYATTLTAAWYFFIRPREERTLEARFGDRMREYRRAVRGFRPRLSPYRVRS
jgi:protein-S-isoprenylcysteine O-methyltransferase Ste14